MAKIIKIGNGKVYLGNSKFNIIIVCDKAFMAFQTNDFECIPCVINKNSIAIKEMAGDKKLNPPKNQMNKEEILKEYQEFSKTVSSTLIDQKNKDYWYAINNSEMWLKEKLTALEKSIKDEFASDLFILAEVAEDYCLPCITQGSLYDSLSREHKNIMLDKKNKVKKAVKILKKFNAENL